MNHVQHNFFDPFQVMRLGDPYVVLEGVPIPDGKTGISFTCPSSCTEENFEVRARPSLPTVGAIVDL